MIPSPSENRTFNVPLTLAQIKLLVITAELFAKGVQKGAEQAMEKGDEVECDEHLSMFALVVQTVEALERSAGNSHTDLN